MRRKTGILFGLLVVAILSVVALPMPVSSITLPFIDDFESGTFDLWDAVFGSPEVTTNQPANGTYSAEFDTQGERIRGDFEEALVIAAECWVRLDNLPSVSGNDIQLFATGRLGTSWQTRARIVYNGTDVLWRFGKNFLGDQHYNDSAMQLPILADTWYHVQTLTNLTVGAPYTVEHQMWVNGTELTDVAESGTAAFNSIDFALFGCQEMDYSPETLWIDDAEVSSEGVEPPEPPEVEGHQIGEFDNLNFDNRELRFACQRKLAYAVGLYWLFYSNHTSGYIEYRTSSDGETFTAPTTLRADNVTFATWNDGTSMGIAVTSDDGGIYYRAGDFLPDGSIDWAGAWDDVAVTAGIKYMRPNIGYDDAGYFWVMYQRHNLTDDTRSGYVDRNSVLDDSSWSSASGFPYNLSVITWHAWRPQMHNLNGTGMYCMYYRYGDEIQGRLWNYTSSSWESLEVGADAVNPNRLNSAVDSNNVIHIIAAPRGADGEADVYRLYRDASGFSTPVLVDTMANEPAYRGESVVTNGEDVYMFWRNSTTMIAQVNYTSGSWGSAFAWRETWSCNIYCGIQTSYEFQDGKMLMAWVTGTSNPYTLWFDSFQWAATELPEYNYVLYGAYDEDGLRDGAINVTFFRPYEDNVNFELNGTYSVDALVDTRMLFRFDLAYNYSRVYYVYEATEAIYVFKPFSPYYYYFFDVVDFVGLSNPYLESRIMVNGTETVVERWRLDALNDIPFVFSWGYVYKIVLISDQGTHTFGSYVAGATSEFLLVVTSDLFPSDEYDLGHVTISSRRIGDNILSLSYDDDNDNTTALYWSIFSWSGTELYNVSHYINVNTRTLTWEYADPTLDYYSVFTATQVLRSNVTWHFAYPAVFTAPANPWNIGIIGSFPFEATQVVGFAIVALVFAAGNAKNEIASILLGLIVTAFLVWLGWLQMTTSWLAIVFGIGFLAIFSIARERYGRPYR